MKRIHLIIITIAISLFLCSCDPDPDPVPAPSIDVVFNLHLSEDLLQYVIPVVEFTVDSVVSSTDTLSKEDFERSDTKTPVMYHYQKQLRYEKREMNIYAKVQYLIREDVELVAPVQASCHYLDFYVSFGGYYNNISTNTVTIYLPTVSSIQTYLYDLSQTLDVLGIHIDSNGRATQI